MDDARVLCTFEVVERLGRSTVTYQDSVMLEGIEFTDQILPSLSAHVCALKARTTAIIGWTFTAYLPERPLKLGRRVLN